MSILFNEEKTLFIDDQITWKEAVEKGVDLLVEHEYATPKLADAIFDSTKKFGAYYVLEKGVALLHAPPGEYALKAGTSVLILKDNIQFNDEDKWARIIITLSAPDSTSHIDFIKEFGTLFTDKEKKEKILKIKTRKELFEIIK